MFKTEEHKDIFFNDMGFGARVTREYKGRSNIGFMRNDMRTYYLMTQDLKT